MTCTKLLQKLKICQKMVWGVHCGSFSSRYQIVSSKDTFLWETGLSSRGGTVHLSRFGKQSWSEEVNVWPILKLLKNLKFVKKWLGMHSLELFAADTRSFKDRKVFSKKLVTLSEKAQFIWVNWNRRVSDM